MTPADIVLACIDTFLKYYYPVAPIVSERMLKLSAGLLFGSAARANALWDETETSRQIQCMRQFALLAAVCANTVVRALAGVIANATNLCSQFLRASRQTLSLYLDYDLEHPDSTSLVTRALISGCLQHLTGKTGAAWHVHGETSLLAVRLRLFREEMVHREDSMESHFLRTCFWLLYISDKAAATVGNRPIVINEALFDDEMTTMPCHEHNCPAQLLASDSPIYTQEEYYRLFDGFNMIRRVWSSAAELVIGLRNLQRRIARNELSDQDVTLFKTRLTGEAFSFFHILDEAPHGLLVTHHYSDGQITDFAGALELQKASVLTVFHCSRLLIVQQCILSGMPEVMGLNNHELTLAMWKLEVAHDFVRVLETTDFLYLQLQGEPGVRLSYHSTNAYFARGTLTYNFSFTGRTASSRWRQLARNSAESRGQCSQDEGTRLLQQIAGCSYQARLQSLG